MNEKHKIKIVISGPPGSGKTILARAIGVMLAEHEIETLFVDDDVVRAPMLPKIAPLVAVKIKTKSTRRRT